MKDTNNQLKLITYSAVMIALTCVMTLMVRIPTPTKGYVNLGDCVVIISGWLLGPVYGTIAGGVGSALADLLAGYPIYIPATFIIKGLMGFIVAITPKLFKGSSKKHLRYHLIIGSVIAELIMILGYYFYEASVLGLGFLTALSGVSGNAVQGFVSVVIAYILMEFIRRTPLVK